MGWKMKKAKVAISFDDGRLDNVAVIGDLIHRGIPSTLFVTTGYVDGSCPEGKKPTDKPAMTISDVVRFCDESMVEIGLHGDMHLNEVWDIKNGWEKVKTWCGYSNSQKFGFASPGTSFSINDFVTAEDGFFRQQILYLAMGLRMMTYPKYRTFVRKASRVIHSPFLFRTAYHDTLMQECPNRVVYRVAIHSDNTYRQVKALIDEAIRFNSSLSLMFHSIGVPDGDTWTWDQHRFERVVEYLTELRDDQKIELVKVCDIVG